MSDANSVDAPRSVWLNTSTPPHVVTLVLIAGLGALSMNIFVPSLANMAIYFDAEYSVVQLAISAYLAVTAAIQLLVGPLSDRFGRRPVMLGGICIFLFATTGCIFAQDITTFLIFRMIQAAVATGMVLSRAIVRDMVGPAKAASMIAYVTMGMSLSPMLAPVIGGVLDEVFGWKASFVFAFACGVLVLFIVWRDMGETNVHRSASFAAQFRSYPELITSPRFWGYTLVAAFSSGAFFAFLGGAPYIASEVLKISTATMGLYFGIISIGYMIGNFISGRMSERLGINRMMFIGSLMGLSGSLLGYGLFSVGVEHPLSLFGSIFFVGVGNGLTLPSANAGMVSVRPQLAGSASGLGGAVMIGGGAALAAITGSLLTPEAGVYPLLGMMIMSSFLAILAAWFVIYRSRIVASE